MTAWTGCLANTFTGLHKPTPAGRCLRCGAIRGAQFAPVDAVELHDHVPAGHVETSMAAFDRINGQIRTGDQTRALGHIVAGGAQGATCDEIEVALALSHQTASARCNDLYRAGIIERGRAGKRATRSGSMAYVWTITDWARARIMAQVPV